MPQNIILPSRPHTCHRAMACVMASAVVTPAVSRVPKFNRVFTQRSTLTGRGTRTERTRGRQLGTVICRSTKFSEQFGDAGAPKPGTLQSPPLYVKRTLRGGQTVRHPGTVIVRTFEHWERSSRRDRHKSTPTSPNGRPTRAFLSFLSKMSI